MNATADTATTIPCEGGHDPRFVLRTLWNSIRTKYELDDRKIMDGIHSVLRDEGVSLKSMAGQLAEARKSAAVLSLTAFLRYLKYTEMITSISLGFVVKYTNHERLYTYARVDITSLPSNADDADFFKRSATKPEAALSKLLLSIVGRIPYSVSAIIRAADAYFTLSADSAFSDKNAEAVMRIFREVLTGERVDITLKRFVTLAFLTRSIAEIALVVTIYPSAASGYDSHDFVLPMNLSLTTGSKDDDE